MKYFLFNHTGCLNRGCEAIVRGSINIISSADPNCQFVLSSYNPDSDSVIPDVEHYKFDVRNLTQAERVVSAFNIKLRNSEEYALRKMYSETLKQAQDCDICLSVGGDTYCYGDNYPIQVFTRELKKLGKKVILWGASIGEEDIDDKKSKSLSDFDAIFTRESLTYELLKSRNLNEHIFLNPDPAFCMEREDLPMPTGFSSDNTLGFNISPLVLKSNSGLTEIAENFIKYIIEKTTLNVLFIPHVTEENNNDFKYMKPICDKFRETGRVEILPDNLNAKQYKGYIARTRFFIGARTHATIAAYSNGVPTISLGYSVKSRGIAKDIFGEEKYTLNVCKIDSSDALIKSFEELVAHESEIRSLYRNRIPEIIRDAMKLGDELVSI